MGARKRVVACFATVGVVAGAIVAVLEIYQAVMPPPVIPVVIVEGATVVPGFDAAEKVTLAPTQTPLPTPTPSPAPPTTEQPRNEIRIGGNNGGVIIQNGTVNGDVRVNGGNDR